MFAWKFFAPGAVAPFTGVRWPDSGWVESVRDGDQGVHACAVEHLPYWLDAELWEVELDGPIARATRQLVGRRGRLAARAAAATDGLCGHEQERAAQAEWLATRLHLAHR